MKLLTRRGVLVEGEGSADLTGNVWDLDEARSLRPLQAAACASRIDICRFRLHAAVCFAVDDRQALEQIFRYIIRLALTSDRVQRNATANGC